jgi:hypothetical protein
MYEEITEEAVGAARLTDKLQRNAENACETFKDREVDAQALSTVLTEWTEEPCRATGNREVRVPCEALPLPSIHCSRAVRAAGYEMVGYQDGDALYREVSDE